MSITRQSVTVSVQGTIVEEEIHLSLVELCRASGATEQQLMDLIAEGALEPQGQRLEEWRFSGTSLRRARTAAHLAHDLDINPPGIALALDLLEQLNALHAQLGGPRRR
jgi:chaperone modulatory protein CbpM